MKLLSTGFLLSILAFAVSCSQGNYAQIEPDDLYFTHNDRKEANANYMASASTNNAYDYNDRDVSNYTNQHSPTINSSTLGSPTIQSTTETFYDANQNPDYVSVQADPNVETSGEYYVENYDLPIIETETVVPQTNIYNIYSANPYANISPWNVNPFSSWFNMSFGYVSYGPYYDPFYNQYYGGWGWDYNPYQIARHDYNRYFNNTYYYGGGYANYGYGSYCYYPVTYAGYTNFGYYGKSNSNSYYADNGSYKDGTKIKNSPRRSRSTVSDYTNGQFSGRNRTSTIDGNSGGRISGDTNNGRQVRKTVPASREINPYKNNGSDKDRRERYGDMYSSSPTIQKNTNTRRKINTTVQRQWSRGNSGINTPTNRTNSNNSSTKRYAAPSRSGQSNSYSRPRSNSSYTPTRTKSSGSSGYSPSRSSSTQRSTPARSTGTKSTSSTTTRKRN